MTVAIGIVLFLLGAFLCFFGARFYRIWFGAVGLMTGILAGYRIGILIFGKAPAGLIFALVLGLLFSLFFSLLVSVGLTLSSAFLFGGIVLFILNSFGRSEMWWVVLLGALAGALLGAVFSRALMIFGSAMQGAYLMVLSVLALCVTYGGEGIQEMRTEPMSALLVLIIALAVGLIGSAVQYRGIRAKEAPAPEAVMRREKRPQNYGDRPDRKTEILPSKKFYLG